jgi:hypothetical protein
MQFSTYSIFLFFLIFISCFATADTWSLANESNEVQIYTKKKTSGLLEIKATTEVKATPEAFINLLKDTAIGPEWIENAISVEVLSSPEPNIMIVQTLLNAPWPLKKRDMITQSLTSYDKNSGVISLIISDKSDYAPKLKNRTRMKNISGQWTLKPNTMGTQITYQGTGEAGGIIPTWLSNKILINSTMKSFENMRKKVIEDKYQ